MDNRIVLNEVESRLWRTLIRVTGIDDIKQEVLIVIPGWNSQLIISRPFTTFPDEIIDALKSGSKYIHAHVNIGYDGEDTDNLIFNNFEPR